MNVEVYRSPRHELMYLYLPAAEEAAKEAAADEVEIVVETAPGDAAAEERGGSADLSGLPAALMSRFGTPQFSFQFVLSPDRQLAAADAAVVLASIREQGFYLQMPPRLQAPQTPDARNPHEA